MCKEAGSAHNDASTQAIAGGLKKLLADIYVLIYQVRHLYWRIETSDADELLVIIRGCYRDLDQSIDDLAKCIILSGGKIPTDYSVLKVESSVHQNDAQQETMSALQKIREDHLRVAEDVDTLFLVLGAQLDDETAILLSRILKENEQCAQSLSNFMVPLGEQIN